MLEYAHEAIDEQTAVTDSELRIVPHTQIRQVWQQVRGGVDKVIERTDDHFLAEDVYMALVQGTSVLMVGYVHQYYVGFVIATPTIGWEGPELHLWMVFNRGGRDVLATFMPQVISFAKARGATRLTASSSRDGWERRIGKLGWHKTLTQYAMEV